MLKKFTNGQINRPQKNAHAYELSEYTESDKDEGGCALYYVQKYQRVISESKTIELKPDSCYAYAKRPRTYAGLCLEPIAKKNGRWTSNVQRWYSRKKAQKAQKYQILEFVNSISYNE